MPWESDYVKRNIILSITIVFIGLCGCQKIKIDDLKEVEQMSETKNAEQENLAFMIEGYGFEAEELEGIDLQKFIDDYQLHTRDYTSEEIREILRDEGDFYQDDGSTKIFSILNKKGTGSLGEKSQICRIGYYCNEGSLIQKVVFDLEKKEFYLNNTEPVSLTNDQLELLLNLPSKWNIAEWEDHCEGVEEDSTGSLYWKLVFELEDETYCVYDGYTKDMSHLPKTYLEVDKELQLVIRSAM